MCERFAVKEVGIKDSSIWVQQLLSGNLAMVKQVKCHKSAAVSSCIASQELPCPHTCFLGPGNLPLTLCLGSEVRKRNHEVTGQPVPARHS